MNKPIIAVIEDMEVRIDWLRTNFPEAEIVWSTTVDDFIDSLRAIDRSRLVLFLLDHDLGGPFFGSCDDSGKNGLDAAKALDGWNKFPAIVWSINRDGATEMVSTLQDKGFVVAWIPFNTSLRGRLALAIGSQVTP